jgi:hypothetical protein
MTLDDITSIFAYRRENFPDLDKWVRSYDSAVSDAIVNRFMEYGWTSLGLLNSNTKVMITLKPYLQRGDGPGDSESKRCRTDQSATSASLPDHPANTLDLFSYNTVESILRSNSSHLNSLGARNRTRDLTDSAMVDILGNAVNIDRRDALLP